MECPPSAPSSDATRPAAHGALDVVRGERELELVRVLPDHPVHQVDLLQRGGHRRLALELGGHVDRPELAGQPARGHPRQVRVGEPDRPGQVSAAEVRAAGVAQCPGEVVMPVYQRDRREHRPRPGEVSRPGHAMDSTAAPCTRSSRRSVRACWA